MHCSMFDIILLSIREVDHVRAEIGDFGEHRDQHFLCILQIASNTLVQHSRVSWFDLPDQYHFLVESVFIRRAIESAETAPHSK